MPLSEQDMPQDPFAMFERWFREARDAGALQPDAMTLATASDEGPSARMVLFKGLEDEKFIFYSNYGSRKARDLLEDRRAALVFYWSVTRHQVRVYGTVRKLGRAASLEYWKTRPRGSQLSALASHQSRPVKSREALERKVQELSALHPQDVPLPNEWGGYALKPIWVEFWEHRDDRLHDRLRYVWRSAYAGWRLERLAP